MSRISVPWALASSVLLLSSIAPAFAAEDEDIVVPGRLTVTETPSSITIITKQDIERKQAMNVLEALRGAPGVTISQNGGMGQSANIKIRGASDDQTLVLIDGVPVNDPSGLVGFDFAYLDSGVVQRIEVLRGAGSAMWGSDAIGGVINVITLGSDAAGASAYAEAGSFSTSRIGADAAWSRGPLSLSGYATAFKTAGISAADEDDGNPEEDGAHAATLSARAELALGGGFAAQAGFRTTQGRVAYDGFGGTTGVVDDPSEASTRESLAHGRLTWTSLSDRFGAEAQVSRSLTKRTYDSAFPGVFRGARAQYRLTGRGEFLDGQFGMIGAEHEQLETASVDAFSTLGGESESSAAFATYQGHFGERVLIEAGLRYEKDDRYGSSTTGRVGAALDAWTGGRLRATLGAAYKAPTIDEVTGGCCTGPNFNLKPEDSREWELGVDQHLFDGRLRLSATYFDREIENLIVFGMARYENQPGITDSEGLEFSASATLGALDAELSFTHNEASPRATGVQIRRVPEDQASLDLNWRATDKLTLGSFITWNGEENDVNTALFTNVVNASWTTIGLRAAYRTTDQLELYGRVVNATDEEYQDIFGYGAEGASAYVGLRVKH